MKIGKIHTEYVNNNINVDKRENNFNTEENKLVKVDISDSARKLAEEVNKAEKPEINDRVEKIRKSILNGTYKVSSERIADRILQEIEMQKGSDE